MRANHVEDRAARAVGPNDVNRRRVEARKTDKSIQIGVVEFSHLEMRSPRFERSSLRAHTRRNSSCSSSEYADEYERRIVTIGSPR